MDCYHDYPISHVWGRRDHAEELVLACLFPLFSFFLHLEFGLGFKIEIEFNSKLSKLAKKHRKQKAEQTHECLNTIIMVYEQFKHYQNGGVPLVFLVSNKTLPLVKH